jgi:diguanylate cyclase (GGDEF)-like protein
MKRVFAAISIAFGLGSVAWAAGPTSLTTLRNLHSLSNDQVRVPVPVAFEATVTYYRSYEKTLFVQDGDAAIYVQPTTALKMLPGDRVLIRGTMQPSFRPIVVSSDITLLHHGPLPAPLPATYDQLIRAERDCLLVSVRARVRSADMVYNANSGGRTVSLQVLAEGGTIDVALDSADDQPFKGLLDAEVEITGAASGRFDGKMEQTGILLHVSSWDGVKVLRRATDDPAQLPITPMDAVLTGYHVQVGSQRMHVHGTVTYFEPGSTMVLQNGTKSLWVQTYSTDPVQIGEVADVTGFPGLHDGFLTLTNGAITDSHTQQQVTPQPATWHELVLSGHAFDLVSIEGKVVTEVREADQDQYVLTSDGQMFSAIYRHPLPSSSAAGNLAPMRQVPLGSRVRITGICMLDDSNPFETKVPFTILMRSFDDIAVVEGAPWLNTTNLLIVVGLLLLVVLTVGAKGWSLDHKVRRQTAALAERTEAEAAMERRMAQLEQRRSRILEDINGPRPLAEILEQIVALIAFRLEGAACWCEITDGAVLGEKPDAPETMRVRVQPIPSRTGTALGTIFAGLAAGSEPSEVEDDTLSIGARLATLAMETRKLYSDLVHRSEFDLLTDIHNRFSLDKRLEEQIEVCRQTAGIFGLIYIDLDEFKQVNDLYGHQVGDLYLQEVARRMKRQLRSHDLLARLGGDEFAALVAMVPTRAGVEEIALRMERAFDAPFVVEGYTLHGSASVGVAVFPQDGGCRDSLLGAADAAMYVAKHTRRQTAALGAEASEADLVSDKPARSRSRNQPR